MVLDTNVVASGLLWGSSPRALLQAARDKRITLFTSLPLLSELTDILVRRKFAKKIAASGLSVDQLVDRYALLTSVVRPLPIPRTSPDPDDDVLLATALAARVDLIVSGDHPHLVSLGQFEGMPILTPAQAIAKVETA